MMWWFTFAATCNADFCAFDTRVYSHSTLKIHKPCLEDRNKQITKILAILTPPRILNVATSVYPVWGMRPLFFDGPLHRTMVSQEVCFLDRRLCVTQKSSAAYDRH